MKLRVLLVVLLLTGPAWPDIDHAYLRKVDPQDPGTVHLFIRNTSNKPVSVERINLNGYEMEMLKPDLFGRLDSEFDNALLDDVVMPNDYAVWYQSVPPVIQPGEVADVMVKLRRATKKLINIKAVLDNGRSVETVIKPVPPDLKFTYIGYSGDKSNAYLYIENTGKAPLAIDKLFCNGEDITAKSFIPERSIVASSKMLIIYTPAAGFQSGAYKAFKVTTDMGQTAEATSRVYSYFPVASFGQDKRDEMFFDPDYFELRYPDKKDFTQLKNQPEFKCYHVFDDPTCVDARKQYTGTSAKEIIKRGKDCYENDPVHPGVVYACEYHKPYGYFIYGETTDIFSVDPYEVVFHRQPPEKNAYYTKLAKLACEPRPLWTIPEAFLHGKNRIPTPDEERIIVYSEIGEGSKGIWYFVYDPKTGYPASPPLEREIGRINQELQLLKSYIVIGDPVSLAKVNAEKVTPYAILCGDKAIVLILVNNDHQSNFDEGKPRFTYNPKQKIEARIRIPSWLKVTGIKDVFWNDSEEIRDYKQEQGILILPVDKLDITKQYLILTDRRQ